MWTALGSHYAVYHKVTEDNYQKPLNVFPVPELRNCNPHADILFNIPVSTHDEPA